MHRNSLSMFVRYGLPHVSPGSRVLEIGPDEDGLIRQQVKSRTSVSCWDTIDFAGNADLTYVLEEPYSFPIESGSYDVVISANVAEHVPKVWRWMTEVARVARSGGIVITVVPLTYPFHEFPVDCWRMYPDGLRALYDEAGLEVLVAEWDSIDLEGLTRRLPRRVREPKLHLLRLSGLMLMAEERLPFVKNPGLFDSIAVGRKR